jgi:hypothetical protein
MDVIFYSSIPLQQVFSLGGIKMWVSFKANGEEVSG